MTATATRPAPAPVTVRRRSPGPLRYQLLGLVFLVIVALFITATIAAYREAFTPVVRVQLTTGHVGNQMQPGADVKARGVLVGEVRAIRNVGDHAVLDLALNPSTVDRVPAGVTARLLPKTLFGERYVALQIPTGPPPARHIQAGATIAEDHSAEAVEIGKVLDDVLPVLRAVQPEKLSSALTAVSTALHGRGNQLGDTFVQLGDYLRRMEPSMPTLTTDMNELAAVSTEYSDAAPQLLQAMSDLTTTSGTFVAEQDNLRTMFSTLTTTSVDLSKFLDVNRNNLINLSAVSRPSLDVLARYAPEYTCLMQSFAHQVDNANKVYGMGTDHPDMVHLKLVFTASRGKYQPGVDTPRYTDDRGPRCYDAPQWPQAFPQYPPGGPIQDGSTHPPPTADEASSGPLGTTPQGADAAGQPANSPAERQLVNALVAPSLGVPPADVPQWADVLVGPLYRGTEVTVQ